MCRIGACALFKKGIPRNLFYQFHNRANLDSDAAGLWWRDLFPDSDWQGLLRVASNAQNADGDTPLANL